MQTCSPFRVLHLVGNLHPSSGGPSRTVPQLVDALSGYGLDVTLLTQRAASDPFIAPNKQSVCLQMIESSSRVARSLGAPVFSYFSHLSVEAYPDLLHSHGLWLPLNHWGARFARIHQIPLVIHPRGMLEPWALGHHAWKKRLAMAAYQASDLRMAQVLIATSEAEYNNIRRVGFNQPVALIPNGIHFQFELTCVGSPAREKIVLFLSRVHPIKGLCNLLIAWSRVKSNGWVLCIAGPDESGHLQEVKQLAEQLGISNSVRFIGEVGDTDKRKLYDSARLFVLPTLSENFGVVVAEALTHGVPVITTKAAPWAGLVSHQCGWWVDVGVDPLIPALQQALDLDESAWQSMSERCRSYARRFDWTDIARSTAGTYQWILGRGERPDCVLID